MATNRKRKDKPKSGGGKRYVSVRLDVELIANIAIEAGRQKRKTAQLIRNMIEERWAEMFDPGTPLR